MPYRSAQSAYIRSSKYFLFTLTSRLAFEAQCSEVKSLFFHCIRLSQALLGFGQIGALEFLHTLLTHLSLSLAIAMKKIHGDGISLPMLAEPGGLQSSGQ